MKKIIVLLGMACVVYSAAVQKININFDKELNDHLITSMKRCVSEEEDLYEFIRIMEQEKYSEDDRFKVFVHCAFKETGFTNDDGTVKARKKAEAFPETDLMHKIILECDKLRADNPVDTTFNYFKCFQDKTPYAVSLQ